MQDRPAGRRAVIEPQPPACEKADISHTCDMLETVDIQMLLIDGQPLNLRAIIQVLDGFKKSRAHMLTP